MITILTLIFSGFGVVASVILVAFIGLVIHFSIVDWMEKRQEQKAAKAELHKNERASGAFFLQPGSQPTIWSWDRANSQIDGCYGEIETPGYETSPTFTQMYDAYNRPWLRLNKTWKPNDAQEAVREAQRIMGLLQ